MDRIEVLWTTRDGRTRTDVFVNEPERDQYGRALPIPGDWHLCRDPRHAADTFLRGLILMGLKGKVEGETC